MSAAEYESLPAESRVEIVDGVLHLMAPPSPRHQLVKAELWHALKRLRPQGLTVVEGVEIRFADEPVHARIPDVVVLHTAGFDRDQPRVRPAQVVLAVEVVSAGSETADRAHKPTEYAAAGIEHYWRVEIRPELVVHTHRLGERGQYLESGLFKVGDTIAAPGLNWARIEVADLAE
jgi:Uma2 family endonuclease